jgi:hypothetical protein
MNVKDMCEIGIYNITSFVDKKLEMKEQPIESLSTRFLIIIDFV